MITIEVDDDVYSKLKTMAEPFIDTPNMVLRRLLFLDDGIKPQNATKEVNASTAFPAMPNNTSVDYMRRSLSRYSEKFDVRSPYRNMFESKEHLIYFQNFNEPKSINWWYRLKDGPLAILKDTPKIAIVCLTIPPEKKIFEIPIRDILNQAKKIGWNRDYFEVNINPRNFRWRELDWSLEQYLVQP